MDRLLSKSRFDFNDLVELMEFLRSKDGCPWDIKQTHDSLMNCTLEEAYEVVEAIRNEDIANLREELGDLLLQVVFHSTIAKDNNDFNIDDVITELVTKLIRRHPHVFKKEDKLNREEVSDNWEAIKQTEKEYDTYSSQLRSVPKVLPSLIRATKVQKKAAKVGFDFENFEDALKKVYEELEEVKEAYIEKNDKNIEEELGDLLFSIVNISRFFKLNAENSLTNAIEKFINRFEGIEMLAKERNQSITHMTIQELDFLWDTIKEINNNRENDC